MDTLWTVAFIVVRETGMFAATCYLVLGLNELLIDLVWIKVSIPIFVRRLLAKGVAGDPSLAHPGPFEPLLAVFIPAWREGEVIGQMLRHTLKSAAYGNYRLYVGCYPNDNETIAAVVAVEDHRVRMVVGPRPGPTTKADCLNAIWRAMVEEERSSGRPYAAVILHDAEDVIHPEAFGHLGSRIGTYDMVQLPVVPLLRPQSRWIAGHYADEFAESHARDQIVRQHIGAALPSAGVGCAFARDRLAALAGPEREGPFDALSLTEDYELGLRIGTSGRALFLRVRDAKGGLVATREYFPTTLDAAVTQKARWIAGIALAGWDRLGWRGGAAERWMRLRDRQSLLVALVTFVGYGSALACLLLGVLRPETQSLLAIPHLGALLSVNLAFCAWRLAMRFGFTTSLYGWREGLMSLPRMAVGALILTLSAVRAIGLYRAMRATGITRWNKTDHMFPAELAAD